jgi:NitT/TauT family transport system substrate-binding protein
MNMIRRRSGNRTGVSCKFAVTMAAFALSAVAATAEAKDGIRLQLKWLAESQFAGYFVAKEKGFYDEQNLAVTIEPGGPDIAPEQVIAGGRADVIVSWLQSVLPAREKGLRLVNVAQIFSRAGNGITCWRSAGIASPADFKGKRIGVVFGGQEYAFLAWASKLGLSVRGPHPDITVVKQGFNVDPLLNHQADCVTTQIYDEYFQILDAGVKPEELISFRFRDNGVAMAEDGLYVLEPRLNDPAFVDRLARFIAASIKGWQYAIAHQEEAARIVVDSDPSGFANLAEQKRQLTEVAKLVAPPPSQGLGWLDPAIFDSTVAVLRAGANPILSQKPEGGWTHDVWERAQKLIK